MSHKLVYNDAAHSYMLNGRRVKSVTAVAKIVPDSYALEQWRKRQVAIGLMLEPRLAERIAVDPENRETVDRVCEEAMMLAGAHHAANRGTQRHRASELADTGGPLLTDQQRADADAWRRTLDKHGVEILPGTVEGFAIWPDHGIAGRFDRFARRNGRPPQILDLKSGENAVRYPQGTAVQLALYARAPLISARINVTGDRSTVTEWTTPPADLDHDHGLVVLLGDDMEVGELWEIDLRGGWRGAQLALSLVDWRREFSSGPSLAHPASEDGAVCHVADGPPATATPLVDLIAEADTNETLDALWFTNKESWTDELTAVAKRRRQQLHQKVLRDTLDRAAARQ